MAVKQTGRKVYKTMQGKEVDMDLLRQKNELTPAVGNARVNARGDELGPGGKIVRKREDVLADFYRDNPGKVVDEIAVSSNNATVEAVEEAPAKKKTAKQKIAEVEAVEPTEAEAQEWEEDDDGNFVKKGD